ncbi:MAG: tetratricopeptide repeat protein [Bacillota bacterium]
MTREPLGFSARHWWNVVLVLVLLVSAGLWVAGLLDGRLAVGLSLAWVLAGWFLAPEILYEHLGFLDRHVFHDYSKARARYRKAVDTKRATVDGMCALASLSYGEGDYADAARILEEARTKRPDDPFIWALLSRVLTRLGRYDEAVTAAVCAGQSGSATLRPLADLALAQALKARGEMTGAAAAYQRAAEHVPSSPEPRVGLTELYLAMGDTDAAGRESRGALRLSPSHPDALYWAGRASEAKGDSAEAGRYYQEALLSRPVDDCSLSVPYRDMVKAVSATSEIDQPLLRKDIRQP